jgi:murein tripeptide amidase MpaA
MFPSINPDGYKYTFEKDRLWRKNCKPYDIFRGVDLNRNFASNWNGNGSSADPKSYDFAGAHAESEPEANVVADFIRKNAESFNIKTYIALHSYSQLLMFPYGHTPDHVRRVVLNGFYKKKINFCFVQQ